MPKPWRQSTSSAATCSPGWSRSLEGYVDDLLDAEDADEREDASLELIFALEEVHSALENGQTDTTTPRLGRPTMTPA